MEDLLFCFIEFCIVMGDYLHMHVIFTVTKRNVYSILSVLSSKTLQLDILFWSVLFKMSFLFHSDIVQRYFLLRCCQLFKAGYCKFKWPICFYMLPCQNKLFHLLHRENLVVSKPKKMWKLKKYHRYHWWRMEEYFLIKCNLMIQ